ncbi:MAG: ankyrin repeat domain-containing protein [bacterium]
MAICCDCGKEHKKINKCANLKAGNSIVELPLKISWQEALKNGDCREIRRHVERGVNLCAPLEIGKRHPLEVAIENGHYDAVVLLVELGAGLISHESLYINEAIMVGSFDVVKYLLKMGAFFKGRKSRGEYPLHAAFNAGNLEIFRYLLEAHSNEEIPLLQRAIMTGETYDVNQMSLDAVNRADIYGEVPLHWAVRMGNQAIVEAIIGEGGDVGAKGIDDATPLHIAAEYGRLQIVKLLLSAGAEVGVSTGDHDEYAMDRWRKQPLELAVYGGYEDIVKRLLEAGANVNADGPFFDINDWTPLHSSARFGHVGIVQLLLDSGADLMRGASGYTPLCVAAEFGQEAIVKLLLAAGATSELEFSNEALNLAARNGHETVVKLFLSAGADKNGYCLDQGVDASIDEIKFRKFHTPLHWAAQNGHVAVVKTLLAARADINAETVEGETPMSLAAKSVERNDIIASTDLKYKAVVEVLHAAGAPYVTI